MTRAAAVAAGLLGVVAGAWGQYKVVDAQGHVTYTDTPPAAASAVAARVTRLSVSAAGADAASAPALPLALRAVAHRYPVVLYTTADCTGCDTGRAQLQRRGIPYEERLVTTPNDVAALERLTGSADLPVQRIGEQLLRGHAPDAWETYLSAAGYPAQSVLQADYRPAPPQPLARPPVPPPAAASASDAPAAPAAPPPAPGGIAF